MEENIAPPDQSSTPEQKTLKPSLNLYPLVLIFIILGLFTVAFCVGSWFYIKSLPQEVACTMEAKICPDGSAVGRSGPKCEFAPCPNAPEDQLSNKKYIDRGKRFGFDYPEEFTLREQFGGSENDLFYYYLNNPDQQIRIEAGPIKHSQWYEGLKTDTETINGITWNLIPSSDYCDAGNCGKLSPGFYTTRGDYYIAVLDIGAETTSANLKQILSTLEFIEPTPIPENGN